MSKILAWNAQTKKPSVFTRCVITDKCCELLHANEFCKQGFCSLDSGVSLTEEKIWISWKMSELLAKLKVTHRHVFWEKYLFRAIFLYQSNYLFIKNSWLWVIWYTDHDSEVYFAWNSRLGWKFEYQIKKDQSKVFDPDNSEDTIV